MNKGDNVRRRSDGRYEARYIKDRDEFGKIIYGYCYGQTYDEAVEKRDFQISKMKTHKEMNLLILGAGTHGQDVYEIANSLHLFKKISFIDDVINNDNVIGTWNDINKFVEEYPLAIVAVGDEDTRKKYTGILVRCGYIIPTLVHPTAFISEGTIIGEGTVICARSTISVGVKIGKGCVIIAGSIVPRKTEIPDWGYFDIEKCIHYHEDYGINKE